MKDFYLIAREAAALGVAQAALDERVRKVGRYRAYNPEFSEKYDKLMMEQAQHESDMQASRAMAQRWGPEANSPNYAPIINARTNRAKHALAVRQAHANRYGRNQVEDNQGYDEKINALLNLGYTIDEIIASGGNIKTMDASRNDRQSRQQRDVTLAKGDGSAAVYARQRLNSGMYDRPALYPGDQDTGAQYPRNQYTGAQPGDYQDTGSQYPRNQYTGAQDTGAQPRDLYTGAQQGDYQDTGAQPRDLYTGAQPGAQQGIQPGAQQGIQPGAQPGDYQDIDEDGYRESIAGRVRAEDVDNARNIIDTERRRIWNTTGKYDEFDYRGKLPRNAFKSEESARSYVTALVEEFPENKQYKEFAKGLSHPNPKVRKNTRAWMKRYSAQFSGFGYGKSRLLSKQGGTRTEYTVQDERRNDARTGTLLSLAVASYYAGQDGAVYGKVASKIAQFGEQIGMSKFLAIMGLDASERITKFQEILKYWAFRDRTGFAVKYVDAKGEYPFGTITGTADGLSLISQIQEIARYSGQGNVAWRHLPRDLYMELHEKDPITFPMPDDERQLTPSFHYNINAMEGDKDVTGEKDDKDVTGEKDDKDVTGEKDDEDVTLPVMGMGSLISDNEKYEQKEKTASTAANEIDPNAGEITNDLKKTSYEDEFAYLDNLTNFMDPAYKRESVELGIKTRLDQSGLDEGTGQAMLMGFLDGNTLGGVQLLHAGLSEMSLKETNAYYDKVFDQKPIAYSFGMVMGPGFLGNIGRKGLNMALPFATLGVAKARQHIVNVTKALKNKVGTSVSTRMMRAWLIARYGQKFATMLLKKIGVVSSKPLVKPFVLGAAGLTSYEAIRSADLRKLGDTSLWTTGALAGGFTSLGIKGLVGTGNKLIKGGKTFYGTRGAIEDRTVQIAANEYRAKGIDSPEAFNEAWNKSTKSGVTIDRLGEETIQQLVKDSSSIDPTKASKSRGAARESGERLKPFPFKIDPEITADAISLEKVKLSKQFGKQVSEYQGKINIDGTHRKMIIGSIPKKFIENSRALDNAQKAVLRKIYKKDRKLKNEPLQIENQLGEKIKDVRLRHVSLTGKETNDLVTGLRTISNEFEGRKRHELGQNEKNLIQNISDQIKARFKIDDKDLTYKQMNDRFTSLNAFSSGVNISNAVFDKKISAVELMDKIKKNKAKGQFNTSDKEIYDKGIKNKVDQGINALIDKGDYASLDHLVKSGKIDAIYGEGSQKSSILRDRIIPKGKAAEARFKVADRKVALAESTDPKTAGVLLRLMARLAGAPLFVTWNTEGAIKFLSRKGRMQDILIESITNPNRTDILKAKIEKEILGDKSLTIEDRNIIIKGIGRLLTAISGNPKLAKELANKDILSNPVTWAVIYEKEKNSYENN